MKFDDFAGVKTIFHMAPGLTTSGIPYGRVHITSWYSEDGYGEDGYDNFDIDIEAYETHGHELVGPAGGIRFGLYVLEPYGDDMDPEIKKKLRIDHFQGVAVSRDTMCVFLIRIEDHDDPDVGRALTLLEMTPAQAVGRRTFDPPQADLTWPEFLAGFDSKRPYHMEIGWDILQQYLLGEVGWSDLRKALQVFLHVNSTYYASVLPWTD